MLNIIIAFTCSLLMFYCIVRLTREIKRLRKQNAMLSMEIDALRKYLTKNTVRVFCKQPIIVSELKNKNKDYISDLAHSMFNAIVVEMSKTFQVEVEQKMFESVSCINWEKLSQPGSINRLDLSIVIEVPIFRVDIEGLKVKADIY